MQQIESLLNRHPPQVIQRMVSQAMESRKNLTASTASPHSALTSHTSTTSSNLSQHSRFSVVSASRYSVLTSYTSTTSSSNLSRRSRLSVVSAFPRSISPLMTEQEPTFTPTGDSFMFCTYCAEGKSLKTFKAKSDWKKHEMRMHQTGEDWPCIVKGCNRSGAPATTLRYLCGQGAHRRLV